MDDRHAPRRAPQEPQDALDLNTAGGELLETARGQRSGRAARTLFPGSPAPLTQTLVALSGGSSLKDHAAPGPSSLQVLRGTVSLRWEGQSREVSEGGWTAIPDAMHGLEAATDAIVLITVAHR